jgi:hypothetical protein
MATSIDTLQDYLEGLCILHADLLHTVDGRRSFARFQSEEEVQQLATNSGNNVVVVSSFYGSAKGSADMQELRQHLRLVFGSKASSYNTADINTALEKAWQIMWDFVARWRYDFDADECNAILEGIDFTSIQYNEVEPFLEQHYGWELQVSFTTNQPALVAARWSDID